MDDDRPKCGRILAKSDDPRDNLTCTLPRGHEGRCSWMSGFVPFAGFWKRLEMCDEGWGG